MLAVSPVFHDFEYFLPISSSPQSFFWEISWQSYENSPIVNCFSVAAFKILSLSLTFSVLILMCLGVGLFASILFGILCASWTCMSTSFTKLGKFSFIIFSNRFPISCSFSSPSGTPVMQMLESLKLSWRLLTLCSFFWVLLSSCSDWLFFASLHSKL